MGMHMLPWELLSEAHQTAARALGWLDAAKCRSLTLIHEPNASAGRTTHPTHSTCSFTLHGSAPYYRACYAMLCYAMLSVAHGRTEQFDHLLAPSPWSPI